MDLGHVSAGRTRIEVGVAPRCSELDLALWLHNTLLVNDCFSYPSQQIRLSGLSETDRRPSEVEYPTLQSWLYDIDKMDIRLS